MASTTPLMARVAIPALALLAAVWTAAGCASSGRASPKEILDYKREVIEENAGELTPEQRAFILYYPGRSKEDIDEALAKAKEDFARREAARARARDSGIEIGSRRRETKRVWVRGEDGNLLLERVPFDPLQPPASGESGGSGASGDGGSP